MMDSRGPALGTPKFRGPKVTFSQGAGFLATLFGTNLIDPFTNACTHIYIMGRYTHRVLSSTGKPTYRSLCHQACCRGWSSWITSRRSTPTSPMRAASSPSAPICRRPGIESSTSTCRNLSQIIGEALFRSTIRMCWVSGQPQGLGRNIRVPKTDGVLKECCSSQKL